MEQVRVGVVGCGIGAWHVEGYAEEPRAKVVALAGLDTDRCLRLAKEHDIPHVVGDYQELLDKVEVDAISIAVPNHLHVPVGLAAVRAGKHVLIEKPLSRNAVEGEELVKAAKEAGVVLAIAFNRRARSDMEVLRRHIDEGGLGEVYYAKAYWLRRAGIPGLGTWFTSKEQAGGGPLIDLGVHVLDMALWLMGNPEVVSVSASTYAKIGPQGKGNWSDGRFTILPENRYEVEDLATAFLRTAGGAAIQLETSWATHSAVSDEYGVTLFGGQGGAEIRVKDYAKSGCLRFFGIDAIYRSAALGREISLVEEEEALAAD
ncbi:MAG TPA: Gfo/Idh/MocA family oxidoreductase [Thermomicrobiales bacterium]|nr:Gfo/Idh/MocA family oxidoreductase [Thermomicrobiales bacterium]